MYTHAGSGENLIKTDLATSAAKDPCQMARAKERGGEEIPRLALVFMYTSCKWGENKMRKKVNAYEYIRCMRAVHG